LSRKGPPDSPFARARSRFRGGFFRPRRGASGNGRGRIPVKGKSSPPAKRRAKRLRGKGEAKVVPKFGRNGRGKPRPEHDRFRVVFCQYRLS
jgi:hypothetical protein